MFLLRNAVEEDFYNLRELASNVELINLPRSEKKLQGLIQKSLQTFESPSENRSQNFYLFVLEDTETSEVIGTSLIHGQHGTDDEPHFFLKVGQEHKFSKTLNTGFVHGTLIFDYEPNGYTELGGLILNPDYRSHGEKLGKQISFARFLYMAFHKEEFTPLIHTELLPPFDHKGRSFLWESLGRKFFNMEYMEADKLSRENKEFIFSLFPSETIYLNLLPIQARESVGKVGEQTLPVKKMLESIGFQYTYEVDPFDGGPHFRAELEKIKPIQNAFKKKPILNKDKKLKQNVLIEQSHPDYSFCAFQCPCLIEKEQIFLDEIHFNLVQSQAKVRGIFTK